MNLCWACLILLSALVFIPNFNDVSAQSTHRSGKTGEQITTILNQILNGYDKRVRPGHGGPPVDVGISIYILRLDSLCEQKMEFTMTYYIRQTWIDQRLKFSGPPYTIPVIGNGLSNQIWLPDTFTVNQKFSNTTDEITHVSSDGEVLRSVRMTTTASCAMNLQFFPLDRQVCNLELESFSSTMNDIKFYWSRGSESITISSEVSLAEWAVLGHKGQSLEISLSTGNYSRLSVFLQLARSIGYYLLTIYLPAAVLVFLSWIPLWFNGEAMTGRILTGVISVLILLQLWQNTSSTLPKISYIKAIDIYLATCIILVLLTIIEHAVITCLIKRGKNYRKSILQSDVCRNDRRKPCCLRLAPRILDWFARLVFPIMFIAFNLAYWKLYLTISDVKEVDLIPFQK